MKNVWRAIRDYGTMAAGLLSLFPVYTIGFYHIVQVPAAYKAVGYVLVPLTFFLTVLSFFVWVENRDGKMLIGVWTFLVGLFGPVLLTWTRSSSETLYQYRLLPMVIRLITVVWAIVEASWKRARRRIRVWRMRAQMRQADLL